MPVLAAGAAPSGRVAIVNAHSNLCLSPAGGGRDKNGEIVQFTCDQDPLRSWSSTVVEGHIVEITNLISGLFLTIAGEEPIETPLLSNSLAMEILRAIGKSSHGR